MEEKEGYEWDKIEEGYEGKMSKRYKVKRFSSCYLMNWVDNTTNKELTALEIEEILHKQEKRIAELEEQLEEKEKEIAYLTKQVKRFNNEAQKYFEDLQKKKG